MSFSMRNVGQAVSAKTVERHFPKLKDALDLPRPEKHIAYGTAGFRGNAADLDLVLYRVGILASLRSLKTGLTTGVVVTASHNPARDNGVKIVDPDGGMLDRAWEEAAEALANAPSSKLSSVIADICVKENIFLPKVSLASTGSQSSTSMDVLEDEANESINVLIARDTRASGKHLSELAMAGVQLVGGTPFDLGLLTTPQLHHCVRMANGKSGVGAYWGKNEWKGEEGYYKMLSEAFSDLVDSTAEVQQKNNLNWFSKAGVGGPLIIDAANGIGALKVAGLVDAIHKTNKPFEIEVRNGNVHEEDRLNYNCGAEHAQKLQKPPVNFEPGKDNGSRCCSIDGDADRVVYHYFDLNGKWNLLDGDKMAALVALFIREELESAGLSRRLSFAIVQTAYANGAATAFLQRKGIKVVTAATGVKFLHHEALQYDIGVYFEANGHGTVLFKDQAVHILVSREMELVGVEEEQLNEELPFDKKLFIQFENFFRIRRESEEERLADAAQIARKRKALAVKRLLHVRQLVNQAVGDAFSDILLTEAILKLRRWSLADWNGMYSELPSRQAKIKVRDRTVVKCTPDERRALAPAGLQAQLQRASIQFKPSGRCFVRPSGTEDAVRVYAEASTQEDADQLALLAMKAVYEFAGGVGDPPETAVP